MNMLPHLSFTIDKGKKSLIPISSSLLKTIDPFFWQIRYLLIFRKNWTI